MPAALATSATPSTSPSNKRVREIVFMRVLSTRSKRFASLRRAVGADIQVSARGERARGHSAGGPGLPAVGAEPEGERGGRRDRGGDVQPPFVLVPGEIARDRT